MIVDHVYEGLEFYIENEKANSWYNPPKAHALLEYDWVSNNVDIKNKKVMDIGSHHGHYSLVFAHNGASKLYLVEAVLENLRISMKNLELNNFTDRVDYIHCKLQSENDLLELCDTYSTDIIKMDIEGWEYKVLPNSIEELSYIECWILELHSNKEESNTIINMYKDMGYNLWWVNKKSMEMMPYNEKQWPYRTTLVAKI